MEKQYDLIIIGSGPGGYVAAIKAAKLGKRIALIEDREIGGTCLNRGCIPTKTLMHSSHLYYEIQHLQELGIAVDEVRLEPDKLRARKEGVVNRMRQGIISLLEANQVTIIRGRACITGPNRIEAGGILTKEGTIQSGSSDRQELRADKILIATGSRPILPRLEGVDCPGVITSDELLAMERTYRKLLIIGGGVIGIELATLYREMGMEVEIIEAQDRILPGMDKEIAQSIAMGLRKKGVSIHTKARVTKISQASEGMLSCEYTEKDMSYTTKAEGILLAVGRRANTQGLFAEGLGVLMEGAYIRVNEEFETSIPGIYAIGDAINRNTQLAHVASAQGSYAVEKMFNQNTSIDLSVIPSCIYTSPEAAMVGMTEEEAVQAGYPVKVGKYPMLGNSKTLLSAGERGFIKVIVAADTLRLLGAVLLCDRATDMVGEFTIAVAKGLTVRDMAAIIRPHPTYGEAITEAVEDVEGKAIHLMPKRK